MEVGTRASLQAINEKSPWDQSTDYFKLYSCVVFLCDAMGCVRQWMERTTDLRCLAGLIHGIWWWVAHSHLARNMEIEIKIRKVMGGREVLVFQWGNNMLH